jgi:primosomal protein N'
VPRIRAEPGVGAAELETLRARTRAAPPAAHAARDRRRSMLLRDLLRTLRLSESPAKSLSAKRGWIEIDYVEETPDPLASAPRARARGPPRSRPAQAAALEQRARAPPTRAHTPPSSCTASPAAARPRSTARDRAPRSPQQRGAIVLVPEIALTPQDRGLVPRALRGP